MSLQADRLSKKYKISNEDAEKLVQAGYDSPAKIKAAKKSDLPTAGKTIKDIRYKIK